MSEMKWIKVLTGILDDRKLLNIKAMPGGHEIVLIWFHLLSEAGKTNSGGWIFLPDHPNVPYTLGQLANNWRESHQSVETALRVYQNYGMIEVDEIGRIFICNWDKHQSVDVLESRKERDKIRKRTERAQKKQLLLSSASADTSTDSPIDFHGPSKPSPRIEERNKNLELEKEKSLSLLYNGTKLNIFQALQAYKVNPDGGVKYLEDIESYQGMMEDELILDAIKQSYGKAYSYCRKILINWNAKGYRKFLDVPENQINQGGDEVAAGRMAESGGRRKGASKDPEFTGSFDITGGQTGRIKYPPRE